MHFYQTINIIVDCSCDSVLCIIKLSLLVHARSNCEHAVFTFTYYVVVFLLFFFVFFRFLKGGGVFANSFAFVGLN